MIGLPIVKTGTPDDLLDSETVDEHELRAIHGNLPEHDLIWECERCDKRGVTTDVFDDEPCEVSD